MAIRPDSRVVDVVEGQDGGLDGVISQRRSVGDVSRLPRMSCRRFKVGADL